MAPRPTRAEERLLAAYQDAALRILRQLQNAKPGQKRVILRRIDSYLEELDEMTATWVQKQLPLRFKDGSAEAIALLRQMQGFGDVDETFGTLHKEALRQLSDDAKLKFASTLVTARNDASRKLSQVEKQRVLGELIAAEAAGENRPELNVRKIFQDAGITGFRSANRDYGLEYYASLVTHNTLADAHNTGAAMRYAQNGVEFARRIERPDCCEICRPMKDKIIWLGDARLLPPSHPWCYGGITPYLGQPDNPIMSVDDPRIPERTRKALRRKAG